MIPGLTPEQEAIVRAVNADSPAMHRAGAMVMGLAGVEGLYIPQTPAEVRELAVLARDVLVTWRRKAA